MGSYAITLLYGVLHPPPAKGSRLTAVSLSHQRRTRCTSPVVLKLSYLPFVLKQVVLFTSLGRYLLEEKPIK